MLSKLWSSIKYYAIGLYNYVDEDHCFLLAAGIAFNVLYCLIPLSLVIFYIFSKALTSEKAITYVLDYVQNNIPLPVFMGDLKLWLLHKLTGIQHTSTLAGIIGGASLLWLTSILFSTLRTSLNAVLGFLPRENMVIEKLRDFLLMLIILILLLASTIIDPLTDILKQIDTSFLPNWLDSLLDSAIPFFVSLGLSIVVFVILFRLLPHERLSRRVIFISATWTVILTELMKRLFGYYMNHVSSIGTLYGTYAFLVGISLWIYYVALVFLVGAEIGWLYREKHEIPAAAATDGLAMATSPVIAMAHPGADTLKPAAVKAYDAVKENPTRPAGDVKKDIPVADENP